ncbi:hypothetical protein K505DRAFT_359943 [Melanomma pulvis-pyrius CBS 109.77]|uniref:Uncharacterized protein n=1 Tax=Melanomma pulvis-pyrius CBS 109.77 TaxID=1314802 RepID=A0A6A6XGX6_9PLEO|nr:hypothetical protein K505DRAFT_359943 [Melanomma pulvis-pyrius CBS 109.77]
MLLSASKAIGDRFKKALAPPFDRAFLCTQARLLRQVGAKSTIDRQPLILKTAGAAGGLTPTEDQAHTQSSHTSSVSLSFEHPLKHAGKDEPTQPATQQVLNPRRLDRNNSGLNEQDIADAPAILHQEPILHFNLYDF